MFNQRKKFKYGISADVDPSLFEGGVTPIKQHLPDWYKKHPTWLGDGKPHARSTNLSAPTIKMCMPFLDSMLSGYTVELWMDLDVIRGTGPDGQGHGEPETLIAWPTGPVPVKERSNSISEHLPIPTGHSKKHFIWENPFVLKTPPGYSLLITHPFNRHDLPFTTLSAIVDADKEAMGPGAIPFFIKEDFEGIIPRGTPIYQVFPFKRDTWEIERDKSLDEAGRQINMRSQGYIHGWYKKFSWARKDYK